MNILQIAGHLGADPETRFTASGQKVTTLRVATNIRKGGKDDTVWWRVTIWGDRFDKLLPYLKKGSAIIVVGEMGKPEIYTDKEGRPQVSLEITAEIIRFSPFGKSDRGGAESTTQAAPASSSQPFQGGNEGVFGETPSPYAASRSAPGQQAAKQSYNEEDPLPF